MNPSANNVALPACIVFSVGARRGTIKALLTYMLPFFYFSEISLIEIY